MKLPRTLTRPRHIPGPDGRTYCGRPINRVRVINLRRDCIEDAECRACQRSDDRRTIEEHRENTRNQPNEP